MNCNNEFEIENKYKLFRSLDAIIHPTISKKNISNYKIILEDNLVPLRVFYPKKISSLTSVIIYIHGNGDVTKCRSKYANICREIVSNTDYLVLAIDYDSYNSSKMFNECYDMVKYLYDNCSRYGIDPMDIVLMGDDIGGTICTDINMKSRDDKDFSINKMILLYPILSGIYNEKSKYESITNCNDINKDIVLELDKLMDKFISKKSKYLFPLNNGSLDNLADTLIVWGNMDPIRDECLDFSERISKLNKNSLPLAINFSNHGFLGSDDEDIKNELYRGINNYISE